MVDDKITQNPLLGEYNTPHGTVPFDLIKNSAIEPAIREGIRQHDAEIQGIIGNVEASSFENTVEALDRSGILLERVASVLFNLLSTNADDELQSIANEVMPLLSEHSNNITLNEQLFARVKTVYDKRNELQLNLEQTKLLEDSYVDFVRNGVNLSSQDKQKYRELTNELTQLTLTFEQNCLKNMNGYQLVLTDEKQLAGLPESAVVAAKETAHEQGTEGYVFTLQGPSYAVFMKYADDRELRKQMYMAYARQGSQDNDSNNLEIVRKIANKRLALAQLLGYEDYASYVLERRMAVDEAHVYKLLNELLQAYAAPAHQEVQEIEDFAKELQGNDFQLMPWDFGYYSNKLKDKKYHVDTELLRPYFELDKVRDGVFGLANRLYGITFNRNRTIPVYRDDVEVYEVYDEGGKYLAVLYLDFFPCKGKQAGAWTSSLQEQWKDGAKHEDIRPQILISTNFTKPTATAPALLTFDEVRTLLHEFGHSLHEMLSDVTYRSLSGTNVYWDFVELPSQFMENYAIEKDFLHTFARHYQTKELLPDEYVQRIVAADKFNVAYACLRQLGFCFIDMAWYTLHVSFEGDIRSFEQKAEKQTKLLPVVGDTCMSTHFSHIFCGGYAAGYYSYKWAEVLEADAFSVFKQKGIFNQSVAASFRRNVLSRGGTEPPMTLYKRFRGQEPTIDALLVRDGIK